MASPERRLAIFKGIGIAGLFIEAVGLFIYVNERASGYDITPGLFLTILGFVILVPSIVIWKKARKRILG